MNRFGCEICEQSATHVCSGLDVPALNFCAAHAVEHTLGCPSVAKKEAQVIEKDSGRLVRRVSLCPSVNAREAQKHFGPAHGAPSTTSTALAYLKGTLHVIATMEPAANAQEFAALLQAMARAALERAPALERAAQEWEDR